MARPTGAVDLDHTLGRQAMSCDVIYGFYKQTKQSLGDSRILCSSSTKTHIRASESLSIFPEVITSDRIERKGREWMKGKEKKGE